jgi:hypothetical protein
LLALIAPLGLQNKSQEAGGLWRGLLSLPVHRFPREEPGPEGGHLPHKAVGYGHLEGFPSVARRWKPLENAGNRASVRPSLRPSSGAALSHEAAPRYFSAGLGASCSTAILHRDWVPLR